MLRRCLVCVICNSNSFHSFIFILYILIVHTLKLDTFYFVHVSFSFLAHLSGRLMGELIVYQSLRRQSVVRPSTISNIFSSETTGPIKFKLHMETLWDAGTKVCSNGSGHMTKMAATPIYGKNPLKIFFSRTRRPMTLGLGM